MIPPAGNRGASRRLVFATRNEGKVLEMLTLLESSRWAVERLPDDIGEYEETGDTFAENACGKALFAAALLPTPVLADDSGLEIDALNGEPGVRSARWLDESMSQAERNHAVLHRLRGTPTELRTARFVCHLALAYGSEIVQEATGVCEGTIGLEPRGTEGFGYDPIFVVPELDATFAEIGREQKSARSHRGRAVRAMADFLRAWQPARAPRAT